MACIDFSFDSRIRKKYVPLINQQRYLRHVKRIAARNLSIPETILKTYLIQDKDDNEFISKKKKEDETNKTANLIPINDEREEETILYSKLNIVFYFTMHHPTLLECIECADESKKIEKTKNKSCQCGRLIYRSELLTSTNPTWKGFDGSSLCSPSVSQFIIRVYFLKLNCSEKYTTKNDHLKANPSINSPISINCTATDDDSREMGTLFLEWNVNLTGLLYIGEEFPKDRRLTKNSIIFGFAEGFYTSVCSVASETLLTHSMPPSESLQIYDKSMIRNSYCLNTLIRIQMVQCIIQATAARAQLDKIDLEEELKRFKQKHELLNQIERINKSVEFLAIVSKRRKQRLNDSKIKIAEIDEKILEHNMDMSSKIQILKEEFNLLNELRMIKLVETYRKLEQIRNSLAYHRKLLAQKFFKDIYVIVPFPDGIGFSINNIHLPSAEKVDQHQHKMISIGLGYVAHLIHLISKVLDIFLFHQIVPYGSQSSIFDFFNKVLRPNEKVIPLYQKSKSKLNSIFFKHGLHLLNRLIVFIRQSMGLVTQDFATTLCNIHSLYKDCFLSDEYPVSQDETLNRFSPYSPSIDIRILENSNNSTESTNQRLLLDINEVKISEFMLDSLWKDLEQLTLNSIKNVPSSSHQSSPFADEIKEIIAKQRQQRRIVNSERLSQLTSSLTFSQASSTFNLLTPTVRSSVISTSSSSPQTILKQRRLSMTQCSSSSGGTITNIAENCPSPLGMNGHCTFQQFNTIRRIRSVSSNGNSPQSLPSNHSFLYPRVIKESTCILNPPLSVSLDNGLNLVQNHDRLDHHSKSSTSGSSNYVDAEQRIPYLNAELLGMDLSSDNNDNSLKIQQDPIT